MGLKLQSDIANNRFVPGPGQYAPDSTSSKLAAPKFGFGSSTRPPMAKSDVPGPGSYYIPTHVMDVPTYSLPSRQFPEFKVV